MICPAKVSSTCFLDEVTVSPRRVPCGNGQLFVADVGGLNGTYGNGLPVESAPLADADQIQIGKFGLLFSQP
jgi:pSer/pThr/pTyr-binding forkhead associated (FHA) protein